MTLINLKIPIVILDKVFGNGVCIVEMKPHYEVDVKISREKRTERVKI